MRTMLQALCQVSEEPCTSSFPPIPPIPLSTTLVSEQGPVYSVPAFLAPCPFCSEFRKCSYAVNQNGLGLDPLCRLFWWPVVSSVGWSFPSSVKADLYLGLQCNFPSPLHKWFPKSPSRWQLESSIPAEPKLSQVLWSSSFLHVSPGSG